MRTGITRLAELVGTLVVDMVMLLGVAQVFAWCSGVLAFLRALLDASDHHWVALVWHLLLTALWVAAALHLRRRIGAYNKLVDEVMGK